MQTQAQVQEAIEHRKKDFSTYPLSNQAAFQKQTFQDQYPKRRMRELNIQLSKPFIVCNSGRELEDCIKKKTTHVRVQQKKFGSKMTRTAFNP